MDEKEILQTILAKLESLEKGQQSLEKGQQELSAKIDKNFDGTIQAMGKVVTVIGEQIAETEKALTAKFNDIENVTAQNAFDVQLMRRKA